MAGLSFKHLNLDWNADPNDPHVELSLNGDKVSLTFGLNSFAHRAEPGEIATLQFCGCSRFRWDATNDHTWFEGTGLYSGQAPKWGEFYEVAGDTRSIEDDEWVVLSEDFPDSRQFLFYFRDDAIEIVARDWLLRRETPYPLLHQSGNLFDRLFNKAKNFRSWFQA
jgi:hypothetical protein